MFRLVYFAPMFLCNALKVDLYVIIVKFFLFFYLFINARLYRR